MNGQFLFIFLSVAGGYIVSFLSQLFIRHGAKKLLPNVIERVNRRTIRLDRAWRVVNGVGIALLLVGLARAFGITKLGQPLEWGFPAVACGITVSSLERALRSWSTFDAYRTVEEARDALGLVLIATLLVTVFELVLSICAWLYISR